MCKIVNGKLVVRVGGGYMNADDFIEQYGKIELLKMMKEEGDPEFEKARKTYTMDHRKSIADRKSSSYHRGLGQPDMKEILNKTQTLQPKIYREEPRVRSSTYLKIETAKDLGSKRHPRK